MESMNSNRMLIKASATGVLGDYDHAIEINEGEQFLIIYGPNGVGKTKFLEIVDALSRLQGFSLSMLPFDTAQLKYSDGSVLSAKREVLTSPESKVSASDDPRTSIMFTLQRPNTIESNWEYDDSFAGYIRRTGRYEQISDSLWRDSIDGELIPNDELRARHEGRIRHLRRHENSAPVEMQEFIETVPSFLIETQRLRAEQHSSRLNRNKFHGHADQRNSDSRILSQAKTIRDLLTKAQTEHSRITQQLDRTFPN